MTNKNERDPWALEPDKPQREVEELNPDETEPDESERNPSELEPGIEPDRNYTPNITPEVPKEQWKDYLWIAIKEAIELARTREDVFRMVRQWNADNNPRIPELDLVRLIQWALDNWDTPFKKGR